MAKKAQLSKVSTSSRLLSFLFMEQYILPPFFSLSLALCMGEMLDKCPNGCNAD